MAGYKAPDFTERAALARAAKEAALEKLRNKPAPDPALVAQREAARIAREAAAAEKRALRQMEIEEAAAAKKAAKEQAIAEAEAKAAEEAANAPAKPVPLTPEEQKAIRDARYAARKARKK